MKFKMFGVLESEMVLLEHTISSLCEYSICLGAFGGIALGFSLMSVIQFPKRYDYLMLGGLLLGPTIVMGLAFRHSLKTYNKLLDSIKQGYTENYDQTPPLPQSNDDIAEAEIIEEDQ